MKNKIVKTLLFIFFIIFFDRTISLLISKYNHLFFKNNYLEKPLSEYLKNKEYNTLILGTSRTYEAIHPKLLESERISLFKWGYVGHGPKYNYYFYKLYKKIKGPPKLVIYGIDYFIYWSVTSPLALSEVKVNKSNGLLENFFSPTLLLLKNKSKTDILFNDVLNSFKISELSFHNKIVDIQNYTGVRKSALPNSKVYTKKPSKYKRIPFRHKAGGEGRYFAKMLNEIHEDNVKIALIVIPDYIGTLKTNSFQRAFKKHLQKLAKKYNNLKVFNYCNEKKFALEDESLFLNGGYGYGNSHVSKEGARILNQMLKKDLGEINFSETPRTL